MVTQLPFWRFKMNSFFVNFLQKDSTIKLFTVVINSVKSFIVQSQEKQILLPLLLLNGVLR